MKTTSTLKKTFTHVRGEEKTVIKISLDDECGNGREDFSITADIYERRGHGAWVEVGGGCCHDHILKIKPGLAPFVALHLSDFRGIPMHAAPNAFWWFFGWMGGLGRESHPGNGSSAKTPGECREIFQGHVRATDAEMDTFANCGAMSEVELQAVIEDLNIPGRWRQEAEAAISKLEEWCGVRFETASTKAPSFVPLSAEGRGIIASRRASGYYTKEAVEARKAAKEEARKQKAISDLQEELERDLEKIHLEHRVKLWKLNAFGANGVNLIYYPHSNEIAANWSRCERLMSKEEFDAMVASADLSALPAGVKFVWQSQPKY